MRKLNAVLIVCSALVFWLHGPNAVLFSDTVTILASYNGTIQQANLEANSLVPLL
jgi:hypothetical protein